jgi:hypothetical protein
MSIDTRSAQAPIVGTFRHALTVAMVVNTKPASTNDQLEALASETSAASELAALTVFDHCDSPGCAAQAYVRAQLKSGLELVFCGHHGHDLMSALAGQGAIIRDDSQLLVEDRPRGTLG